MFSLVDASSSLYVCQVCNKEFRMKGWLKKHMISHQGILSKILWQILFDPFLFYPVDDLVGDLECSPGDADLSAQPVEQYEDDFEADDADDDIEEDIDEVNSDDGTALANSGVLFNSMLMYL